MINSLVWGKKSSRWGRPGSLCGHRQDLNPRHWEPEWTARISSIRILLMNVPVSSKDFWLPPGSMWVPSQLLKSEYNIWSCPLFLSPSALPLYSPPSPEPVPCLLQEMAQQGWKGLQWFLHWKYSHHCAEISGIEHERPEPNKEQEEWHLRQETSDILEKNPIQYRETTP